MEQKLVTRKQFADLCGVSGAAVTKACDRSLQQACVGKRIDANHPTAQKYLAEKTAPVPEPLATGVDARYDEAIEHCRRTGRWSISNIQRGLKVGYERAKRMYNIMDTANVIPAPGAAGPAAQSPAYRPAARTTAPALPPDHAIIEPIPEEIEDVADWTLRELFQKFGTATRFTDWLKSIKEIENITSARIKNAQSRGRLVSRELVTVGVIDPFNSAHMRLMTDGAKAITSATISKHSAGLSEQEIEKYNSDIIGSFIRPVKNKIDRNLASVPLD